MENIKNLRKPETEKREGNVIKVAEIIPFPTPSGVKWKDVKITFINDGAVRITIKDITKTVSYVEMGFQDKRGGERKEPWHMLKLLADKGGLLTDFKYKDKTEKTIQRLKEDLRRYFMIKDNPIPYLRKEGYKTVFNIECKSQQREDTARVVCNLEIATDPHELDMRGDTTQFREDESD